jgi:aspartyl-tRNA(Asn)/glutamyl-tRNA(Gln) amidotransferase subunit A
VLSAGYYDAYYLKAQKVRTRIADDFRNVFQDVDVLLTPATPSAAFVRGEKSDDHIAMYLNDVFTVPASMAGLPGITLPAGLSASGLPLGLQIVAPAFGEETLFRAASVVEEAAAFDARPEEWWTK